MGKAREKAWELEASLPREIQRHTDKLIRGAVSLSRRVEPLRRDTQRKGEAWAERHIPSFLRRRRR